MEIIHSAKVSQNTDVFSDILKLYAPQDSLVLDMTFGRGLFWTRVNRPDIKRITCDIAYKTPDILCDFTKLPIKNNTINMCVLDPPYAVEKTNKHTGGKCRLARGETFSYGLAGGVESSTKTSHEVNVELYKDGAKEAYRVLKKNGFLVLKTQDDGKFFKHLYLMDIDGFECEDLFIVINPKPPVWDPRWKVQHHARKNHSYFIILRKVIK